MASSKVADLWRSRQDSDGGPGQEERRAREFERPLFSWQETDGMDRRRFLQLSGASLALAGATGCAIQPAEKIVPYVEQPEEVVPGKPIFFATSHALGGYARPLLAESHLGRPTKVEGNPEHPASLGATDLFAQATVLGLYDPDRVQAIRHFGKLRPWRELAAELTNLVRALEAVGGRGLRILTGAVSSPTLAAEMGELLGRLPQARWHVWEAAGRHGAEAGARMAFGEPLEAIYDVAAADVIVALDSDFLTSEPGDLAYARQFTERRRVMEENPRLTRLYAVESVPTNTGAMADHRLALAPSEVAAFAHALAAELGSAPRSSNPSWSRPEVALWVREVARDLAANRGRGLVVAGDYAPPEVHVLAHAINQALGNAGSTVSYIDPVLAQPPQQAEVTGAAGQVESLAELVRDMRAGEVSALLVLSGNPAFDAPADLGFAEAMQQVERRIYLGPYENETSGHCQWMIPESHYLESWGDGRAYDGTVTFTQPLIEPLYETRTATELLALLNGRPEARSYDVLWRYWQSQGLSRDAFRRAIHDGYLAGSAAAPRGAAAVSGAGEAVGRIEQRRRGLKGQTLELALRPDPTIWDGSFANNGWLQECPKPWTRLTWDNALLLAPGTAQRLGLTNEDVVRVSAAGGGGAEPRTVEAPVWVVPGHPEDTATLHVGYGRSLVGAVGSGTGVNAYPLRTTTELWNLSAVSIEPTGAKYALASTQDHFSMDGRGQVRTATLEHYRQDPEFAQHWGHSHAPAEDETMYPPYEYDGYAWGMSIDLNACTGCHACVVACQVENNIPVVGKSQVINGREMHWLRIDRYFEGGLDAPVVHHQPVMCQHCELAPCEPVCPVAATVHSSEGLNDMVYNRCVGTRYCSNNCPYKVRRFNFLTYHDHDSPVLSLLRNPDVTVRDRGVMEKCTYCVQRINAARQESKVQGRKIRDGEIQTACQQVCPSEAIVFGDLNDETSEVHRWQSRPTSYGLLAELNTRPRTSYLAKVRNPNPALERA